jgi:hypothetical protein
MHEGEEVLCDGALGGYAELRVSCSEHWQAWVRRVVGDDVHVPIRPAVVPVHSLLNKVRARRLHVASRVHSSYPSKDVAAA